jgi:peptidoglycan-N-acetylglucosamine deacetylase
MRRAFGDGLVCTIVGPMYLRVLAACLVLGLALFSSGGSPAVARPPRKAAIKLAVTFDDLPASAVPGYDSAGVLAELARVLGAHGVKRATGFVIGTRLDHDPDGARALSLWTSAGHELGNHSYSHQHPAELGADGYLADVLRMDALLRPYERAADQRERYFRYPFLDEGNENGTHRLVTQALEREQVKLARVSVDFQDWGWAEPYARCMEQRDAQALAALSQSYLESANAALAWSLAAGRQLGDRPSTHVLLLHVNAATLLNLDALLTLYERAGVEFVSLGEALRDPLYHADYAASAGGLLTKLAEDSGRTLPPGPVIPHALLELVCR